MGRKGSLLVPFYLKGLLGNKYPQYLFENINGVIEIILPRKTKNLSLDSMELLRDWNLLKGRPFKSYTKAKQGMYAALRRSDYLERVEEMKPKLCYRILSSGEVKEKKRKQKDRRKKLISTEELQCPSSVESGFESDIGSPPSPNLSEEVDYASDQNLVDYDSGIESPHYDSHFDSASISPCNDQDSHIGQSASALNNEFSISNEKILEAIRHDPDFFPICDVKPNRDIFSLDQVSPASMDDALTDLQMQMLIEDLSINIDLDIDINENKMDVEEIILSARVLKLKSEEIVGKTSILVCEPKGENLLITKSVFDSECPSLDYETFERLQAFNIVEVKKIQNYDLILFSDSDLIALNGDIYETLTLSDDESASFVFNNVHGLPMVPLHRKYM